jgi:hypothetical protein
MIGVTRTGPRPPFITATRAYEVNPFCRGGIRFFYAEKSRSNLEPVSQRATLGTLLTVRPASDFAVCSVTPVRTFGWSVRINTVKLQYPKIAAGSQNGLRRGGRRARGSLARPRGGVWGRSDIPAPPNT